jgi:Zn-dependent protease with chaperone function
MAKKPEKLNCHHMSKKVLLVLVAILILGCATKPKERNSEWILDKTWYENHRQGAVNLKSVDGKIYTLKGEYLWNYYSTSMRLINLTQIPTALVITNLNGLNAFAYKQGNVNRVGITIDALNKFGNDPDAIAAVMGHELAHLKLDHQSIRQSRQQTTDITSAIVGGILGAFIPFGGTITSLGATAITTSYSRDEEREADEQGMIWAMNAGYSPCGLVRLNKEMMKTNSSGIAFLSTHPMSAERLETANQLALSKNYGECN